MQLFGRDIQHLFEDPEDRAFREEWEEKREQRVIEQCSRYGLKDERVFFDMIELPSPANRDHETATKEDFKLHEKLMKRQECHTFYGKKFCYHTEEGEVITEI